MSGRWRDPPIAPPGPEYPQPQHDPRVAQYSALATTEAARHARPPWKFGIALRFVALLARKPARVASVAIANKMARIAWAVMARGGVFERGHAPMLAAA